MNQRDIQSRAALKVFLERKRANIAKSVAIEAIPAANMVGSDHVAIK
jgi:hypothetical protein